MSQTRNTPIDPNVFEDERHEITITEDELLGTHTYNDVLYTGETNVVNVVTNEVPNTLDRTVDEAKKFAKQTQDGAPRVAVKQPPERAIESGSPYVSSVFCHFNITGSMEWHIVMLNAWRSEKYNVKVKSNYQTGDLKITISIQGDH